MSLLVLCLAAVAIVSWAASTCVGLGVRALTPRIVRLAPAAQARLYLFASFVPLLAALAVLSAALAPSFGWIADHCAVVGDPHTHPHICAEHHVSVWPSLRLTALALIISIQCALAVARRGHALVLGYSARRTLDNASEYDHAPGVRVLPIDEPQAFVLGLVRPTLYITRGLLAGSERRHLGSVLAHERSHLDRRDPLRRFFAGIGLAFHVPGIAGGLDRRLARAHEMAADEAASQDVGSREHVASALVALARAHTTVPRSAVAFSGSEVESRVTQLLDARERRDRPKTSTLFFGAAAALVTVAAGADAVHHGIELLLGALGS